jgi:hypothetical protein
MFLPPPSLRRPYDQDGNFPVWLFGADHRYRSAGDHLARLTSAQPLSNSTKTDSRLVDMKMERHDPSEQIDLKYIEIH